MEIIKKQICKTTYKGNCPMCGKEQISSWVNDVDCKYYKCIGKEYILKIKDDLVDTTIVNIIFGDNKFGLRNYQSNCCLKWLRDGMGIIKAPTGSGKTIMAPSLY